MVRSDFDGARVIPAAVLDKESVVMWLAQELFGLNQRYFYGSSLYRVTWNRISIGEYVDNQWGVEAKSQSKIQSYT